MFKVASWGPNRLGLAELVQRFADEQWVPSHYSPEQAAAFVIDQFKRAVSTELEMPSVSAEPV
jgi:hypothetical protein